MDHAKEARKLLLEHRYGALSTLSKSFNGHPFGSVTSYLVDHDGSLLMLMRSLAKHIKNIVQDSRTILITHDQSSPQQGTKHRM